jgi:hypothetical protein
MIGVGIGIPFIRVSRGAAIDAQAQAHFDRVIADGGLVPSGLSGVNAFFTTIKTIYATSDITTAISVGLDAQVLGYKLGAGAGTTAGQAAQKLYSCSGASGDVVQTTAASQPLLLVHSGANYYFGSGANANFLSTPNAAANQITGDIGIIAKINMQNYNVSVTNTIISKRPFAGNMSYAFQITSSGTLFFRYSSDGGQTNIGQSATSSVSLTTVATNGQDIFVGMFRNAANGLVDFYYSLNGTSWSNLGTQQVTTLGNMFNSTNAVGVGNLSDGLGTFLGRIYQVDVSASWQGANLFTCNPSTYNAATSQTQWTSSTGEVWSLNVGTATTGYKGQIVTKTIVQGDGVDDRLFVTGLTSRTAYTVYIAMNTLSFAGRPYGGEPILTKTIFGFSNNISMYGGTGSFDFAGEVSNRLQMLTANFQASPNVYSRINNNARQTTAASIGNAASTGVNIFTDGGGANHANVIMSTLIQSVTNDPLNDLVYDYIRSINGNAF